MTEREHQTPPKIEVLPRKFSRDEIYAYFQRVLSDIPESELLHQPRLSKEEEVTLGRVIRVFRRQLETTGLEEMSDETYLRAEEAIQKMYRSNQGLLVNHAKVWSQKTSGQFSVGDLLAVAQKGLVKAIINFDPDYHEGKAAAFSTYAVESMKGYIRYFIQSQQEYFERVLPFALLSNPEDFEENLTYERQPSVEQQVIQGETNQFLLEAIADPTVLTQRERYVIHSRFAQGLTLQVIAQELGVTHEMVRIIEKKALQRLKLHFIFQGFD